MGRYIVAHWRGEQSLPRSVFLNWLLVYLLLVLFAGLAETFSVMGSGPLVWIFIGVMLVWLVWSIVGIVRSGWRLLADPHASRLRKLGAVIAIPAATAFAIVASRDVYHLFFSRPVPGGDGIKAAWLHAAASVWWISARRDIR